jgi:predicted N-acetyltransferase YhbS
MVVGVASVAYTIEERVDAAEVADLFRRSGINRPVDDLPRIEKMVAHANLMVCAREGARLVGFARALTDFSFCCYLSDLAVDRAYQRQGIGQELVRRVRDAIGPDSMLLLLAAPTAMDYYPHIGFDKVENAWSLPRQR